MNAIAVSHPQKPRAPCRAHQPIRARRADPGQEITDWLEQIEEIEIYSPHAVPYSKKRELNERLDQIGQAEAASLRRSAASAGHPTSAPSRAPAPGLSDAALVAMFSSLRKPE